MIDKLDKILEDFHARLESASEIGPLEEIKTDYLGKKGLLTGILKNLKNVSPEERGQVGRRANEVKSIITQSLAEQRKKVEDAELDSRIYSEWIDVTLDCAPGRTGGLHPISLIQHEIEDIFTSMGFSVLDGPHIETDYYNFEALNIPADHPARDMQDTFYFENGAILRTHTSSIQIRGMEKLKPPFRIIGPGKVFRVERTDASHEAAFHQVEGMLVAEGISVAHLIRNMKVLLAAVFKSNVKIRLRPGFFPFVEPGFELDIACRICSGDGCSVCSHSGWVELMPCGMVHPNVLRISGIDPEKYSGFAFGLGLDRLVMMRYEIEDIRLFHSGDLRFSGQFA